MMELINPNNDWLAGGYYVLPVRQFRAFLSAAAALARFCFSCLFIRQLPASQVRQPANKQTRLLVLLNDFDDGRCAGEGG